MSPVLSVLAMSSYGTGVTPDGGSIWLFLCAKKKKKEKS